jgi:hypothetical protein
MRNHQIPFTVEDGRDIALIVMQATIFCRQHVA